MKEYTHQEIESMQEAILFASQAIWSPSGQQLTKDLLSAHELLDTLMVEGRI